MTLVSRTDRHLAIRSEDLASTLLPMDTSAQDQKPSALTHQ
jgi:hypothetical protein